MCGPLIRNNSHYLNDFSHFFVRILIFKKRRSLKYFGPENVESSRVPGAVKDAENSLLKMKTFQTKRIELKRLVDSPHVLSQLH